MHHLPNDILHLLFSRLEFPSLLTVWLCGDSHICLEIEKWTTECRLIWHGLGPLYGDFSALFQKGYERRRDEEGEEGVNTGLIGYSSRVGGVESWRFGSSTRKQGGPLFWPQLLSFLPNLSLLDVRHSSEIHQLPVKAIERIRLPKSATDVSLSFLGVDWVISDVFDFAQRLPKLVCLHLSHYSIITNELLRIMPVQLQKLEIQAATSSLSSSWPLLLAPSLIHLLLSATDKSLSTAVGHPWMSSLQSLQLDGYVSNGLFDHLAPTCAFSPSCSLPTIAPRNHTYSFLPIGTTDFGVEPQIELPDFQVSFPPSLTSLTIHSNKRILFNDLSTMLPSLTSLVVGSNAPHSLEFVVDTLPPSLRIFKCQEPLFPVFEESLFLLLPHLVDVEMSSERTHFGLVNTLPTSISRLHIHLESCYGHDELPDYGNLEALLCEGGELLMTFGQFQSFLLSRPQDDQHDSHAQSQLPQALQEQSALSSAEALLLSPSRLTFLSLAVPLLPCVTRLLPPTLTSLSAINRHNPRRERVKMILDEWESVALSGADFALPSEAVDSAAPWQVREVLPQSLTFLQIEEGEVKPTISRRIFDHLWRHPTPTSSVNESILTHMSLVTLLINSEKAVGEVPSWILKTLPKTLKRVLLRITLPSPPQSLNADLSQLPRGLRQLILVTSPHDGLVEEEKDAFTLPHDNGAQRSPSSKDGLGEATIVRLEEETWRRVPSSLLLLSLPCPKPPPSRIPLLPPLLVKPFNSQYHFLPEEDSICTLK